MEYLKNILSKSTQLYKNSVEKGKENWDYYFPKMKEFFGEQYSKVKTLPPPGKKAVIVIASVFLVFVAWWIGSFLSSSSPFSGQDDFSTLRKRISSHDDELSNIENNLNEYERKFSKNFQKMEQDLETIQRRLMEEGIQISFSSLGEERDQYIHPEILKVIDDVEFLNTKMEKVIKQSNLQKEQHEEKKKTSEEELQRFSDMNKQMKEVESEIQTLKENINQFISSFQNTETDKEEDNEDMIKKNIQQIQQEMKELKDEMMIFYTKQEEKEQETLKQIQEKPKIVEKTKIIQEEIDYSILNDLDEKVRKEFQKVQEVLSEFENEMNQQQQQHENEVEKLMNQKLEEYKKEHEEELEEIKEGEGEEKITLDMIEEMIKEQSSSDIEKVVSEVLRSYRREQDSKGEEQQQDLDLEVLDERIWRIVQGEIDKLYADRINRTDYAITSMGGEIVDFSQTYEHFKSTIWRQLPIFKFKKWLMKRNDKPEIVITPGPRSLGECFALKGSQGFIVVKLPVPLYPDGFSIDHIEKNLSPDYTTALKKFKVWGYYDKNVPPEEIGTWEYQYQSQIETFDYSPPDPKNPRAYKMFKLEILSNYGNEALTCLYRFRIHGKRKEVKKLSQ